MFEWQPHIAAAQLTQSSWRHFNNAMLYLPQGRFTHDQATTLKILESCIACYPTDYHANSPHIILELIRLDGIQS